MLYQMTITSKIFNNTDRDGGLDNMPRQLRIGMIDADLLDRGTRHPNLAQMKMSAFCKSRGHIVTLIYKDDDLNRLNEFDALLVSKVFDFSRLPEQLSDYIPLNEPETLKKLNLCIKEQIESLENSPPNHVTVMIGGTGFFADGGRDLHHDVEHIMPDYHLYDEYVKHEIDSGIRRSSYYDDYVNYSIGFTTRGCFRKCDFCVNKKYDKAAVHSPVSEFLDPTRPAIYLWDDNILACSEWETIINQLQATGKPFQFRQGLDMRLMNDKRAEVLSKCRYHGDFIFAFDHIEDKGLITEKLTIWRKYCKKMTKLYVLCAFDPQNRWDGISDYEKLELKDIEATFERIQILMTFGCLPYIMRYKSYKTSQFRGMYVELARWCNQPRFFKKMSFRDFCEANQKYHRNKSTWCSSYRTLKQFERDYPNLAERYFDIRYDRMGKTNLPLTIDKNH